jgi:hypothetical protein
MASEELTQNETEEQAAVVPYDTTSLNAESLALLNQIIAESDETKTRDLTYLFNMNQNKKTMVRMDKLSGLQDNLVDQFVRRIAERPDEISNKELMDGLKIVQDILERGQRQVSGADEPQPFIQINSQDNSVNVGATELPRESRDKVKNAVLGLLAKFQQAQPQEVDFEDKTEEKPE